MLPRHEFASIRVVSRGVVEVIFGFVSGGNIRCNDGLLFHNKHALKAGVNKSRALGRPGDNFYGPPNTVGSQNVCHVTHLTHRVVGWLLHFWKIFASLF
jgi:hypothetical protein